MKFKCVVSFHWVGVTLPIESKCWAGSLYLKLPSLRLPGLSYTSVSSSLLSPICQQAVAAIREWVCLDEGVSWQMGTTKMRNGLKDKTPLPSRGRRYFLYTKWLVQTQTAMTERSLGVSSLWPRVLFSLTNSTLVPSYKWWGCRFLAPWSVRQAMRCLDSCSSRKYLDSCSSRKSCTHSLFCFVFLFFSSFCLFCCCFRFKFYILGDEGCVIFDIQFGKGGTPAGVCGFLFLPVCNSVSRVV